MELSRRDALVALAASSAVISGTGEAIERISRADLDDRIKDETRELLLATAEVVYPDEVTPTDGFIRTYTLGRTVNRPEYQKGIQRAVSDLRRTSRERYGVTPEELSVKTRDRLLRTLGVGSVVPDPNGSVPERIRYYIVNELLYALYTTPVGGELLDHENPKGHPGGLEAYQRGPE